jgi:hypothetical protein
MINKQYATTRAIHQIAQVISTQGAIILPDFFETLPKKSATQKVFSKKLIGVYSHAPVDKKYYAIMEQFVSFCTGKQRQCVYASQITLSHRQYSLLDDSLKAYDDSIDVIIELSEQWSQAYGGLVIFEGDEPLTVEPTARSVTIINSSHKRSFYSYVNHTAQKKTHTFIFLFSSFFVCISFQVLCYTLLSV